MRHLLIHLFIDSWERNFIEIGNSFKWMFGESGNENSISAKLFTFSPGSLIIKQYL